MFKPRKQLALLLAAVLCAAVCVHAPLGAGARLPGYEGGGTETDPYLIADAEGLFALAAAVNSGEDCEGLWFLLTADIDLSPDTHGEWTAIGVDDAHAFRGHFCGGGHTVSGCTAGAYGDTAPAYAGLFGRMDGGSVSGLGITGAYFNASMSAGGVAASVNGTLIEDADFSGSVICSAAAGGIFGIGDNVTVSGCTVNAEVRGGNYSGGVFGMVLTASFADCAAYGSVNGVKFVGGVGGYCCDGSFADCFGFASVEGGDRVGGLFGNANCCGFTGCVNVGSMTAERFCGGVCGFCSGCTFENCVNYGAIRGDDYVGGVVGWSDDGSDFGDSGLENLFDRCMNAGEVTGVWGVGGIIGDAHDATARDCFNKGVITADQYAGGVTGYTAESSFTNCYTVGGVTANVSPGAFVGKVSYLGSEFTNCFYLDTCCAEGDAYCTPRTDAELRTQAAYTGFDFAGIWRLSSAGYPYAGLEGILPVLLSGDVNGDGALSFADVASLYGVILFASPVTPLQRYVCDVNGDGLVSFSDVTALYRAALGR